MPYPVAKDSVGRTPLTFVYPPFPNRVPGDVMIDIRNGCSHGSILTKGLSSARILNYPHAMTLTSRSRGRLSIFPLKGHRHQRVPVPKNFAEQDFQHCILYNSQYGRSLVLQRSYYYLTRKAKKAGPPYDYSVGFQLELVLVPKKRQCEWLSLRWAKVVIEHVQQNYASSRLYPSRVEVASDWRGRFDHAMLERCFSRRNATYVCRTRTQGSTERGTLYDGPEEQQKRFVSYDDDETLHTEMRYGRHSLRDQHINEINEVSYLLLRLDQLESSAIEFPDENKVKGKHAPRLRQTALLFYSHGVNIARADVKKAGINDPRRVFSTHPAEAIFRRSVCATIVAGLRIIIADPAVRVPEDIRDINEDALLADQNLRERLKDVLLRVQRRLRSIDRIRRGDAKPLPDAAEKVETTFEPHGVNVRWPRHSTKPYSLVLRHQYLAICWPRAPPLATFTSTQRWTCL